MELRFTGVYTYNEMLDRTLAVVVKTEQPYLHIHCKIKSDTILFNDNSEPMIGDKVECRLSVESVTKGHIFGSMQSWFKMKG